MQYMLLIYGAESHWSTMDEAEQGRVFGEYMAFTQDIVKSGHYKAGDPLEDVATASTVRVRNGKVLTTDGPFAETKEQLGGYYIIEAANLDEALKIAARIPSAGFSSSTTTAASPATSIRAASGTVTTGVPEAIASTTGRPNPSWCDDWTRQAAPR